MPNIRDVAKRAGVAPITVSRVINNSGYVSDETRRRVEEAIDELGYVPNMLGPSLRFNRTNTLALLVSDITNPFWTTVVRGVEDAANENGYYIILGNTDESEEKVTEYLDMMLRRRIDGFLLVPGKSNSASVQMIREQNIPVVVLDRQVSDPKVDVVRSDSRGGAYQLTQHLLALGHQHISALTGSHHISTSTDRVTGYTQAMTEANLSPDAIRVFWGDFTQTSGFEMTKQALAVDPPPTALLAANNFIAIGALKYLREAGVRVPEDISLVAFDDLPLSLTIDPFLTVAVQPAYEMGYQATELLLNRLSDGTSRDSKEIILPVEIVVRKSTGSPQKGNSLTGELRL